jgi:hypothetical protein
MPCIEREREKEREGVETSARLPYIPAPQQVDITIHTTVHSFINLRQTFPLSGSEVQRLYMYTSRSKQNIQKQSNACSCLSETYYQLAATSSAISLHTMLYHGNSDVT